MHGGLGVVPIYSAVCPAIRSMCPKAAGELQALGTLLNN